MQIYKPISEIRKKDQYFLCECCRDNLNMCNIKYGDICANCNNQICPMCFNKTGNIILCCTCNDVEIE